MTDPLEQAEQRRQHHNLFHQGVVTGVANGQLNVTVMTASGELELKGLLLLGRNPAGVQVDEPCFVVCPQGDPAQGVVVMQLPDPVFNQMGEQVAALRREVGTLRQQISSWQHSYQNN